MDQQSQLTSFQMLARPEEPMSCGEVRVPRIEGGKLGLNVRAVEFIAKPGMTSRLQAAIDGFLSRFLAGQFGFAGTILLTAHKEPRRILILTFWRTHEDCSNRWEFAGDVQRVLGPLIDAFSRVRTYQADISELRQRQASFGGDLAEIAAAGDGQDSMGQGSET